MPMDGVMLGFVARQLDTVLQDGRVDRVIQPEKDEIHLMIRAQGANHRLVLSAAASAARVHLSEHAKTGPMEPPMFCMLLRKYLCGGRVLAVRRIAGDRILEIDISNLSELGDPVTRTMVVEIMRQAFNIILRAADGRITMRCGTSGRIFLGTSGSAGSDLRLSACAGKAEPRNGDSG